MNRPAVMISHALKLASESSDWEGKSFDRELLKRYGKNAQMDHTLPSGNSSSFNDVTLSFRKSLTQTRETHHEESNLCFRRGRAREQVLSKKSSGSVHEHPDKHTPPATSCNGSDHQQEQEMKTLILDRLSQHLSTHRYLSIREIKDHVQPEDQVVVDSREQAKFCQLEFGRIGVRPFRQVCCSGKMQSVAFQQYVSLCSDHTLNQITNCIEKDIYFIVKNEFGNYVVQRILKRDRQFVQRMEEFCMANFLDLTLDEFASRVMQALIPLSPKFRKFTLATFSQRLDLCFESISAVFLISMAISCSTDPSEYSFVRELVVGDTARLLSSKFFKRVVVSFLEKASIADLDALAKQLDICSFVSLLSDKYRTYLLLVFLQRAHRPTLAALGREIRTNLYPLLQAKFFKFLVTSLIHSDSGEALHQMHMAFRSVDASTLRSLHCMDKDYLRYFVYIAVATAVNNDIAQLPTFLLLLKEYKLEEDVGLSLEAFTNPANPPRLPGH